MKTLHLEKKGLRGLAIAESFREDWKKSILSGVVMRLDLIIDGFVLGETTLGGNDSVNTILNMYKKLNRSDINYVLVSGIIISMYNIVSVQKIASTLGIPVIGVTYRDSHGIEDAIKYHFPDSYESKLNEYRSLENREKIKLRTGYELYVRKVGCTINDAKNLLDKLTFQGSIPEPLRVAQLLAKTILQN